MAIEITPQIKEALTLLEEYAQAGERRQFVALAELARSYNENIFYFGVL
jgi:hypothetical protein